MRYMVKTLGIAVIEHIIDIISVYRFMHVGLDYTFVEAELVKVVVQ